MKVPQKCKFRTVGNRHIIHTGEIIKDNKGEDVYKISWVKQPPHVDYDGNTLFDMKVVRQCFYDGTWKVIEVNTNEDALMFLLKEE